MYLNCKIHKPLCGLYVYFVSSTYSHHHMPEAMSSKILYFILFLTFVTSVIFILTEDIYGGADIAITVFSSIT